MTTARGERTTLFVRGIPRDLVREVKAVAARRGATLASVVSDALERSLVHDVDDRDDLGPAMAWYRSNRARLLRQYRGSYVAIIDGAVIDHDEDFSALASRVFREMGERPVFMPKVGEEKDVVRVRSPRLRR